MSTAQPAGTSIYDVTIPPGRNYDKAEFRLWYPPRQPPPRGVIVLMPGAEYDARPWVSEPFWQALATRHRFALLACYITDKPHPDANIDHYVDVSEGSGDALLRALDEFARLCGHVELAAAPLAFWGFSAGGEFNYQFANWRPDRVIVFIVNKGGVYYTALSSAAARHVPAMLFLGSADIDFRIETVRGLFSVNQYAGAWWSLTAEPGVGHDIGRSKELGALVIDEIIPLRLPDDVVGAAVLRPVDPARGYIGDPRTLTFQPWSGPPTATYPMSFLPTLEIARGWQRVSRGEPLDRAR